MAYHLPKRHHVPHREIPESHVFLTWRLDRHQRGLNEEERGIVLGVIRTCEPRFAVLLAAVVMDDHVHALVKPEEGVTARKLVIAWKGMAAHRLCDTSQRRPPIWQRAYFDRWLEDPDRIEACIQYIIDNPKLRWPAVTDYPWIHKK